MKLHLLAGLALASVSLCACSTASGLSLPFTGNPAADAKTAAANLSAVNSNLAGFNQQVLNQVIQHCSVKGELNVAIPNPVPTGNLKIACDIEPGGLTAPLVPGGGSFGGAGAAATTLAGLGLPQTAAEAPPAPSK